MKSIDSGLTERMIQMTYGMMTVAPRSALLLVAGVIVAIAGLLWIADQSSVFAQIDTTAPTILSIAITSDTGDDEVYLDDDGVYGIGDKIEVTVTFSEDIRVLGSPQLELDIGGTAKSAAYKSVAGAKVDFSYTVASGDSDTDGMAVSANKLTLEGGAIKDLAGVEANLSHNALPAQSGHKVDGIRPTITSIQLIGSSGGSDGIYTSGENLIAKVYFSEIVIVTDKYTNPLLSEAPQKPLLKLNVGGSNRYATNFGAYSECGADERVETPWGYICTPEFSFSRGSNLSFEYEVARGDLDQDGVSISADAVGLNEGTIKDAAGNDAVLTHSAVSANSNHIVDAVPATVESVAFTSNPGSDNTYGVGDTVEVTVTFSESVLVPRWIGAGGVVQMPLLYLNIGGVAKTAKTHERSTITGTTLVFSYTVQDGDNDTDGISIGANKLTIQSNGGITDNYSGCCPGGENADLRHNAVADDEGHQVGNRRPATLSTDATLKGLTLTGVDFGTFTSSTESYSARVPYGLSQTATVTSVSHSGARYVTKRGGAATDDDGTVSLAVGSNVITVVVTAEDGSTTKTYTVTVTRDAPSTDATLKWLTLRDIDFGTFAAGTESYSATVANGVTWTHVAARPNDSKASYVIKHDGWPVMPRFHRLYGIGVPLSVGSNVFTIEVTAEDRSITKTYTVTVTRASSPTAATGAVVIRGTVRVGEMLTADPSGIADTDGLTNVSYSYQWISNDGTNDSDILDATGSTYTVVEADEGKTIKVKVSFTDDKGKEETLTSEPTATVEARPNTPATGSPTITGTARVGETLTASTSGIADADGLTNVSYSYQWISNDGTNDSDIQSVTGATYTLVAADQGKTIKVKVSFTDDAGNEESLTSTATPVVPIEATLAFSIDGTTVTCDPYTVHIVNVLPIKCDDPTSIDQGANNEIGVEIEIARSASSQLHKFGFYIYQMEDNLGHSMTREANDLCLGPGLADSASMEVTPGDGGGNFQYTDEGTIFSLCPVGTYQLYVPWFRYDYEDQEYEYAGAFRRYFFIDGDDEEATSIEQVKWITPIYPDPAVSHGDVQIEGIKQTAVLNRTLTTFALSIDGLVPDSNTESIDYVVRVRIIDDGSGLAVPWCHVGNVGYSYLLKTVSEDGRWEMDTHVLGNCLWHQFPDTLQIELFNGSYEFIAGKDISLGRLPNSPATGAPTISGTVQVGETLTADTSSITDVNGLDNVSFSYQWLSSRDTEISGATGSTYSLISTDLGKTIKVKVSFTDDEGNNESLTSTATATVQARPNSVATGAPTISGTAQVGETLTASTSGIADTDGLTNTTFSYQWIRRAGGTDTDISGAAGSTHALVDADEGKTVKVRVSFTDDRGNSESLTSTATATVQARPNSAATGAPTFSGTAQVGETLTADTSSIADTDGLTSATFTYQWIRSDGGTDADISGATGSTYVLVDADEGKTIKVRVSFTDDAGNEESLTSAATATVAARPNTAATGAPTVTGTPRVGETLTASTSGIADADGLTGVTFAYQWLADDTDISDATGSTYTLAAADQGKAIKVRVSFTDDRGHQESLTSAATSAVAASTPPVDDDDGEQQATPLTASAHDVPASHDGSAGFEFELHFSPEPSISYRTLRDHALTVTGGELTKTQRKDTGSNLKWIIGVKPSGNGDVTVTLPATTDCDDESAICTSDGEMLSNTVEVTVPGPDSQAGTQNSPPTGAPAVSGTAQVGETLTVTTTGHCRR